MERMITVKYLQSITMSARMWNMIGQYRDGNGIVKTGCIRQMETGTISEVAEL